MEREIYPFQNLEHNSLYVFTSEGIIGEINKVVLISPISDDLDEFFYPLYNLAFGDLVFSKAHWRLDDSVRTGNGDMPKVIATVAAIAMDFLAKHSHSTLSFQGYIDRKSVLLGKNQRNVLYQRAINSNWEALSGKFAFWGVVRGRLEEYKPGYSYDQILAKLR